MLAERPEEPVSTNAADQAPEPIASAPAEHTVLPADGDADRIDTAQLLRINRDDVPVEVAREVAKLSTYYAGIAATLGVIGLLGGLFVPWMCPFSIGAVVFAEFARRQGELHWPVKLGYLTGVVGILFGGVWLVYALGLLAL